MSDPESAGERQARMIFIFGSLAVFIVAFFFYYFLRAAGDYTVRPAVSSERFYLDTSPAGNDPMLTPAPALGRMLAGPIITAADPSLGPPAAPVVIVIFSDFECGYCQAGEEAIRQAAENFPGLVRIMRKDYPESDRSSASFRSALAARCAGRQGKFWPFHDFLSAADELQEAVFLAGAEAAGLALNDFRDCLANETAAAEIADNMAEADALGIRGVPFVYVNDQAVLGEVNGEEIDELIRIELDRIK